MGVALRERVALSGGGTGGSGGGGSELGWH